MRPTRYISWLGAAILIATLGGCSALANSALGAGHQVQLTYPTLRRVPLWGLPTSLVGQIIGLGLYHGSITAVIHWVNIPSSAAVWTLSKGTTAPQITPLRGFVATTTSNGQAWWANRQSSHLVVSNGHDQVLLNLRSDAAPMAPMIVNGRQSGAIVVREHGHLGVLTWAQHKTIWHGTALSHISALGQSRQGDVWVAGLQSGRPRLIVLGPHGWSRPLMGEVLAMWPTSTGMWLLVNTQMAVQAGIADQLVKRNWSGKMEADVAIHQPRTRSILSPIAWYGGATNGYRTAAGMLLMALWDPVAQRVVMVQRGQRGTQRVLLRSGTSDFLHSGMAPVFPILTEGDITVMGIGNRLAFYVTNGHAAAQVNRLINR